MAANSWIKFYPADWRSDPGLRTCGLTARGLWIEMLSIMHEATPRGSMVINGVAVKSEKLAMLSGATVDEVNLALSELENAGVLSRKKNGVIYSKKMEKEENLSRKRRESGEKGGRASLCKIREKKVCLSKIFSLRISKIKNRRTMQNKLIYLTH
ncbi:hypothetical protein BAnh1_02330 [Bartonella australis AUST/NH1]|uniref:Uncharacterized protein n=1 Tax=Bartonella australis (strain Aust/NH1) TaxID=1094489 RepID=M1P2S8_BARAA|nr:hypothetical protein [Bartonella australis]AGF74120.1 hypothetical protein BAnh1_02330 [Bartonella australis AUST/NH1]